MLGDLLVTLHHQYGSGVAYDVSEHGNHGAATDVLEFPDGLYFGAPTSRIDVESSPILSSTGPLCAGVTFELSEDASGVRRNLIEGHLSFALFIDTDMSLHVGVRSQGSGWQSVQSSPGVVSPSLRHNAQMLWDGLSTCYLVLDNTIVAQRDDIEPPSTLGPNGVAIGAWPEAEARYVFRGLLVEAFIARGQVTPTLSVPDAKDGQLPADVPRGRDPVTGAIPRGPIDRDALSSLLTALQEAGYSADDLSDVARRVSELGRDYLLASLRANPQTADLTHQLLEQLENRLLHTSLDQPEPVPSLPANLQPLPPTVLEEFAQRSRDLLRDFPLDSTQLVSALDALGLAHLLPHQEREAAANAFDRMRTGG